MSSTANSAEPSFTAVVGRIFVNLQDLARSEVKLAKTEVREEIAEMKHGASWLAVAILSAFFAACFVLLAGFFALLYIVPQWAAALIMAGGLVVVSGISLAVRASIVKAIGRQHSDSSHSHS